jgi:hypothetical protein
MARQRTNGGKEAQMNSYAVMGIACMCALALSAFAGDPFLALQREDIPWLATLAVAKDGNYLARFNLAWVTEDP